MNENQNQDPKIVTDEDWKAQARREKEKISQDHKKTADAAPDEQIPPAGPLPPADFMTLVNSLLVQIFFCLGRLQDPSGNQPEVNLDLAKHHIDMLEVLEQKTKGNLTDDESKKLALALHEARMQYVQSAAV